jgi:hypothetical protein
VHIEWPIIPLYIYILYEIKGKKNKEKIFHFEIPVKAEQCCLLHMYRQGRKLQITQAAHCYIGNHGHHTISGILQFHPATQVN